MSEHGDADPDTGESDERLIESVRLGEVARFSILVRRHNRSLYRLARSIVRDEHEAEDIVQHTHVAAFAHLHQFEGRATYATWLARIAAHEALARRRRRVRALAHESDGARAAAEAKPSATPEDLASRGELARALEAAIDALPAQHRSAFVLRYVEGLDGAEAAAWLGVTETNLRVLVHRARLMLRAHILEQVQASADELFSIGGERCARVTRQVAFAVLVLRPMQAAAALTPTRRRARTG
jgi:RNA polymerase sigma-70 factor (ECF subfamily)